MDFKTCRELGLEVVAKPRGISETEYFIRAVPVEKLLEKGTPVFLDEFNYFDIKYSEDKNATHTALVVGLKPIPTQLEKVSKKEIIKALTDGYTIDSNLIQRIEKAGVCD